MAQGISVKLPLQISEIDGAYGLNKRIIEMAAQNLKMIVLTSPGERIMEPEFGVGIRNYLFENNTNNTLTTIKNKIGEQVGRYLPYIVLNDLQVSSPAVISNTDKTIVMIKIAYTVPAAGGSSVLTLPIIG